SSLAGVRVDGYPAWAVAARSFSSVVLRSSNVTTACLGSSVAVTFSTPCTFWSAFLTVMGQAVHDMSGTLKVTVLLSARTLLDKPTALTMTLNTVICQRLSMSLLLIEKRHEVRKNKGAEHQRCYAPKHALVDPLGVREGTQGTRLALCGCGR